LAVLGGLSAVCAPPSAMAGNVFMKNGYIIQGPVVDRDEESVVLGWDHGKMKIHRRFIDQVVYDAGEEERLEEWERLRVEDEQAAREALAASTARRGQEGLPADLDDLLQRLNGPALDGVLLDDVGLSGDGGGAVDVEPIEAFPPDATDGAMDDDDWTDGAVEIVDDGDGDDDDDDATDTVRPDVNVIPPPEELLGARVERSDGVFSMRQPRGWKVSENDELFEIFGNEVGGVRPSINVIEVPRGDLSVAQAFDLVLARNGEVIEGFEILAESRREFATGAEGLECIGRGSVGDKTMTVRQVAVATGESIVVLSGFSSGDESDPSSVLIDQCFETAVFGSEGAETESGDR